MSVHFLLCDGLGAGSCILQPLNADCDGFKRIKEPRKSQLHSVLAGILRPCSGLCSIFFCDEFFSHRIVCNPLGLSTQKSADYAFFLRDQSCGSISVHVIAPRSVFLRMPKGSLHISAEIAANGFNKRIFDAPIE